MVCGGGGGRKGGRGLVPLKPYVGITRSISVSVIPCDLSVGEICTRVHVVHVLATILGTEILSNKVMTPYH